MTSKDTIMGSPNVFAQWLRSRYVKRSTNYVHGKSRTSLTRRVAIAWPTLRARSPTFESPLPNAAGILEATRISPTTRGAAPQGKNLSVNVNGVARRVDGS